MEPDSSAFVQKKQEYNLRGVDEMELATELPAFGDFTVIPQELPF